MNERELLIAGLDIALAFLIVLTLTFLAVRFDDKAGSLLDLPTIGAPTVDATGDFSNLNVLGVYLDGDSISISEMHGGGWSPRRDLSLTAWRRELRVAISRSNRPVVIYEATPSSKFGDAVRESLTLGRSVGVVVLSEQET